MYLPHVLGLPKFDLRVEGGYTDVVVAGGPGTGGFFDYWDSFYHDLYTNKGNILGSWIGRDERRISMSCFSPTNPIGRGMVAAGAMAALLLTTAPTTAFAHGPGVGAAVGLGILGGVLAGAAVASSVPPAYAVPPSAYYYPPQGYYQPAPAYYYAPVVVSPYGER